jgi:hypothetical protein
MLANAKEVRSFSSFEPAAPARPVVTVCAAIELVKPDPCAGLLQRNLDTAEVRSELHSRFRPLQDEPHTFFISQANASDAANEGAAATDRAVGAGKVADLPYA